jgi:hypothetical protein
MAQEVFGRLFFDVAIVVSIRIRELGENNLLFFQWFLLNRSRKEKNR